ncbi:MAG TPA: diguanylate cyclase [Burkholderiales bacterium]|nr:diguanylate cyclase [Burkholderiales bacterium]
MSASVSQLEALLDALPDAAIVVDDTGRIVFASSAVTSLLGYEGHELTGQPLSLLVPQRFRASHERHVSEYAAHGKPMPMGSRPVLFAVHKSGAEVPVSISLSRLEVESRPCSVAMLRDASRFQEKIGEMLEQAELDTLTGLGNRLHLASKLASSRSAGFALLYLDLAQFKPFNDKHGHRVGDEVLRIVARRIKATIRATDTAVRVGGDEFVVVLEGLTDTEQVEARAMAVAESIVRPVQVGSVVGEIGVNIGGAIYPLHAATVDELLERADEAMYRAKRSMQTYCLFGSWPRLERAL